MLPLKAIFDRADLHVIGGFVTDGGEAKPDSRSYSKRLDDADELLDRELEKLYPEFPERNRISELATQYVCSYTEVYFELGMKIGALLLKQLCAE